MKKALIFVTILLVSCGNQKKALSSPSSVEGYGYSPENPILVGSGDNRQGPANERNYLNLLLGPNGEEIKYVRKGSCCPFETKNGILGGGMLDIYEITYEGLDKPIVLYLNMYDPPKDYLLPAGFKLKE